MKKETGRLNRRDALKLAGIGGAAALIAPAGLHASATGPKKKPSKKSPLRIVIVGGGMAGTTLAYRLRRAITWPDITVFEPQRTSAWYQPGLTMLGTGSWGEKALEFSRRDFIPDGVRWVESPVVSIDAEHGSVKDAEGKQTPYDYLVIASGAVLDYGAVEGLSGEIRSLQMLEKRAAWMGDPSIGSIYYLHGAAQLHEQFNTLIQKALELQKGKLTVLFTQDSVAVKSPGAAKSALFSLVETLNRAGVRHKVDLVVTSGDGRLSASDEYDAMYRKMLAGEQVAFEKKRLTKIDAAAGTAGFDDGSVRKYDYIHVTPPMRADRLFERNGLTDGNGWIDVVESTLQHKKFGNVFAVGDAAGISALKTGAAIVEQVKTVVDTIRAIDEGKKPTADYRGYGCDTVLCPKEKSALFEAYDRRGKPTAVLSFMNPLKCHGFYWYLNEKVIKNYVLYGVMRGWA